MANSSVACSSRSNWASGWRWLCRWSVVEPMVAVAWYAGLARCVDVPLTASRAALLFSALWLVYMADRLLDVRSMTGDPKTERHRFVRHHAAMLTSTWVGVFCASVCLAVLSLSPLEWLSGVAVSAATLVYLSLVHVIPPTRLRLLERGAKEAGVALLFVVGSTMFIWGSPQVASSEPAAFRLKFGMAALPFLLLVLQNLLHLARVERAIDVSHGTPSVAWGGTSRATEMGLMLVLALSTLAAGLLLVLQPASFDDAGLDAFFRVCLGATLGSSLLSGVDSVVPPAHADAHHLFADVAVLVASLPLLAPGAHL